MLGIRMMMAAAGGQRAAEIAFTDSTQDGTTKTIYTFANRSLGTASANRKIVVGIGTIATGSAQTISSVTIGGVSASVVVTRTNTFGTAALWQADVPSGTTGDIVVTWAANTLRCGIGVWAIYGAESAAHDTGSSIANPMTDTLNIPAGGVAVGYFAGADNTSITWTGLTENFDAVISSPVRQSGASAAFASAQTGLTITATPGSAPNNHEMVIASWGPA